MTDEELEAMDRDVERVRAGTYPWSTDYICPTCSGPLASPSGLRNVTGGHRELRCNNGHTWSYEGQVAQLVPDDLLGAVKATIDSFAFKWQYNPEALSEERRRVATEWFYDKFGFIYGGGEPAVAKALAGKRRVLDAGCGLGNLLMTFARLAPHAECYGVDLSPALFEIPKLWGGLPDNVRLVQGDLTRLPITGEFDWIVSDGVLHHTASTRNAFMSLAKRLAPGGELLVYVYKRKAPMREYADNFVRAETVKMSPAECLKFSKQMAELGRQLREAKITLHFDEAIPILGIHPGDHDLQRFIFWHFLKCFWDDGGNEVASVMENFDWYHPTLAHRHDPEEVRHWHREAGLELVRMDVADSGISTWGRRPV